MAGGCGGSMEGGEEVADPHWGRWPDDVHNTDVTHSGGTAAVKRHH